ncbi:AZOBR_p60025 family cell surface glycopolymer formation protein [Leptospira ryugenii]|uniref:AZOBR_p60025 family cell surface glycopolymer formation protein n=1 Tax=Leptospira ryugenii TaxID=1917863 RepID=UPI001FCE8A2A|nr:hypothetical protein [Leptospira ryugenii]
MGKRWLWSSLLLFLLISGFAIKAKIEPYQYQLSSLIGIWDGFAEVNPELINQGFVVFKDGGYDGQFFYLIAKSIFQENHWGLVVDSYFFRMHRLGLSLAIGLPSYLFGFSYYPQIAICVLWIAFLYSFFCLYQLLPDRKYLALFYLFSPFTLNSNLLLVADGFFTSLSIISLYLLRKDRPIFILLFFLTLTVVTRELGITLLPCYFFYLYNKEKKTHAFSMFFPILVFISLLICLRLFPPTHLGTNPLDFKDMTDLPLFGFIKSFFDSGTFHFQLKESPKFIFLLMLLLLSLFFILNLKRIITEIDAQLVIILAPILVSLGVIFIAEEGYWRSFDNLSRMFTWCLPNVILLLERIRSKWLSAFLFCSSSLFLFLLIRILFITPNKEFYLYL